MTDAKIRSPRASVSVTQSMKAAVIERHGGPEVLRIVDMPQPIAAPGEVLVRVLACGLNHGLDGRTRQNGAGRVISFPHVLGTEIVGRVVPSGLDTSANKIGSKVIVVPWIACESCRECTSGDPGSCANFRLRGISTNGGNAEYIAVPESHTIEIPETSPVAEAAALPVSYTTACVLINRVELKKGETILVLGAAGTVGIAAVQLAKTIGAEVIAAAGSAEKLQFAQKIGADKLVNYNDSNWGKQIADLTGGRGVDVVIEHIGAATWPVSVSSLAVKGRLAMCGASSGWDLQINARELWRKSVSFHFGNSGSTAALKQVIGLWTAGKIKPVIAQTFPLEQIKHAHVMLSRRELIGKLVITFD